MANWKTFFFDGNQWFGKVDSPEKFRELLKAYSFEDVSNARIAPVDEIEDLPRSYHLGSMGVRTGDMRSFGFRREHVGKLTLGEWAKNNEFNLADALLS